VRVPRKQDREILGVVESMLGANKIRVRCMDGVVRLGRIPGKMKNVPGFAQVISLLWYLGISRMRSQMLYGDTPDHKWTGWKKEDT